MRNTTISLFSSLCSYKVAFAFVQTKVDNSLLFGLWKHMNGLPSVYPKPRELLITI